MSAAGHRGCTTCDTASLLRRWTVGTGRISTSQTGCRIWPRTWGTCPLFRPITISGWRPNSANRRAGAFIDTPVGSLPQEVLRDATVFIVVRLCPAGLLDRLSSSAAGAEPSHAAQLP